MATITLFGLDIGKHFHLVGQDANANPSSNASSLVPASLTTSPSTPPVAL